MIIGQTRLRTKRVVGAVAFGLVTAAGFGAGAALMAAGLTEPQEIAELRNILNALRSQNEDLRAEAAELRDEQRQTEAPLEVIEAMTAEAERSLALQAAIIDLVQERDRLAKALAEQQRRAEDKGPFEDGAVVEITDEDGKRPAFSKLDGWPIAPERWRLKPASEAGAYVLEAEGAFLIGLAASPYHPWGVGEPSRLRLTAEPATPEAAWHLLPRGEGFLIINAASGLALDAYLEPETPQVARAWRLKRVSERGF